MKEIDKLNFRPFTRFCMSIAAVPSSYLAGLTIEEQLLWLCSYLEKEVIPAVNNNAEALEELQGLFTELHDYVEHYFDNLDVQEEINNKLDDMAEDGTLESILLNYVTTQKVYLTATEFKNDSNIIEGMKVKTLGYYNANDGGGANYIVTATSSATKFQETLQNDLYGELITDSYINIKQCGAKSNDKTFDNATIINNLITMGYRNIYIPLGKFYTQTTISYVDDMKPLNLLGCSAQSEAGVSQTLFLNSENVCVIIGNTGAAPIINLMGSSSVDIEKLNIVSIGTTTSATYGTSNPSVYGIFMGTTETHPNSQYHIIHNCGIRLEPHTDTLIGSCCIYNVQAEIINVSNCVLRANTCVFTANVDVYSLLNNYGYSPSSSHNSCQQFNMEHITMISRNALNTSEVSMICGSSDCDFEDVYTIGKIKLISTTLSTVIRNTKFNIYSEQIRDYAYYVDTDLHNCNFYGEAREVATESGYVFYGDNAHTFNNCDIEVSTYNSSILYNNDNVTFRYSKIRKESTTTMAATTAGNYGNYIVNAGSNDMRVNGDYLTTGHTSIGYVGGFLYIGLKLYENYYGDPTGHLTPANGNVCMDVSGAHLCYIGNGTTWTAVG